MSAAPSLLFSPIRIGRLTVPNRIVFPAHFTGFGKAHHPTERHARYYAERARGGVGLIVTEITAVHPASTSFERVVWGFDPGCVPGFRRIAEAVHAHGTRIMGQLWHCGRDMATGLFTEQAAQAPSALRGPASYQLPHALSVEEIQDVVAGFVRTATHLREAGFDGAEVHAGHGYLVHQFLSPLSNQREDGYGGSPENRLRFLREILTGVRSACGPDFALGVRISADEFTAGGLTQTDATKIAAAVSSWGLMDVLSVSVGNHGLSYALMIPDMHVPPGAFVGYAAALRGIVKEPVVAVGRINDPVQAERILAEGQADLVAICRGLIADPDWPAKARAGRGEEIRPCVACNQECIGRLYRGGDLACIHNVAAGREEELGHGTLRPTARPRRVVVVGGGPAGLEAARVAALRGHRVSLYERERVLGGQVRLAATPPLRAEFGGIVRFLEREASRLGVTVVVGNEATVDVVLAADPEVVVVATGARPGPVRVTGTESTPVMTVHDVLAGEKVPGRSVVVIDGGRTGWESLATAEWLADQGYHVEVVSRLPYVGFDLNGSSLLGFVQRAAQKGIVLTPQSVLRAVGDGTVTLGEVWSDETRSIEGVDAVVIVPDDVAEDGLVARLRQAGIAEVHVVGDAAAPRTVAHAILEGHRAARAL